jgi:hypothetical protein
MPLMVLSLPADAIANIDRDYFPEAAGHLRHGIWMLDSIKVPAELCTLPSAAAAASVASKRQAALSTILHKAVASMIK